MTIEKKINAIEIFSNPRSLQRFTRIEQITLRV